MCTERLTLFPKVFKFGTRPAYLTQLNFSTKKVENIIVTDPNQYRLMPDCPYPVMLSWLNPKGGWDWFLFTEKHSYAHEVSGGSTFINEGRQELYSDRGKSFRTMQIQSGYISKEDKELLAYVTRSIAVFYWPENSVTPIPVRVDEGTTALYREGDRGLTLNFSLSYSQLEDIQSI